MTPATPGHFSEYSQSLFDADEAVLPVSGKLPSYIRDHRKRLRERFMTGGALAMPDYELLELVLFRAVPRCDMKPLARRLLETFGDFNRVLSAPKERLAEVQGVGSAVVQELKIVEAASHRLARARVMQIDVIAIGLLSHHYGTQGNRTISHLIPGPQKCSHRRLGTGPRYC